MESALNNLLRVLALGGLLTVWAVAAQAERGDHDTPATDGQNKRFQPSDVARTCRSEDGWVLCRDAKGHWYRDHFDPFFGLGCGASDNWPCASGRILPRDIVIGRLHDRDFDELRDLRLHDDVYTVRAIDPYGRPVRLTIDAHSGRILRAEPR